MPEGDRKEKAKKKFSALKKEAQVKHQVAHSKGIRSHLAAKQQARAQHDMEDAIEKKELDGVAIGSGVTDASSLGSIAFQARRSSRSSEM